MIAQLSSPLVPKKCLVTLEKCHSKPRSQDKFCVLLFPKDQASFTPVLRWFTSNCTFWASCSFVELQEWIGSNPNTYHQYPIDIFFMGAKWQRHYVFVATFVGCFVIKVYVSIRLTFAFLY